MVANKIKGIRAAVYYGKNTNILKLVREHNDANVLSLSGGFLSEKERNLDVYKKIMERLSSYKLVKRIKDVLLYKCFGSIKCWNSSAFRTKTVHIVIRAIKQDGGVKAKT